MIDINIPGFKNLVLEQLVLDYNGTLALDGSLLPGVRSRLEKLSMDLDIVVLTGDIHGNCTRHLKNVPVTVKVLETHPEDQAKLDHVEMLGPETCACIGNGFNDRLMLARCGLGIGLVQAEGACPATLMAADIICTNINIALDLFLNPGRMVATLKS